MFGTVWRRGVNRRARLGKRSTWGKKITLPLAAILLIAGVLGCADAGGSVASTDLGTATPGVSQPTAGPEDREAALRDLERAKIGLQQVLADPVESAKYPGLDILESSFGPVGEWVYIAGAELKEPATGGTLLVTEAGLYFADFSGKAVVSFLIADIASLSSEDVTISAEVSGQDVNYDAAILHVASSSLEADFVVDRTAAADVKLAIGLLRGLREVN